MNGTFMRVRINNRRLMNGAGPRGSFLAGAATFGRLESDLPSAASGRWDARAIRIRLNNGSLASRAEEDVFSGANRLAVEAASGGYEVLQFRDATLGEDGVWTLSPLLRGQAGTEADAAAGAIIGARAIVLNGALIQPAFSAELRGAAFDWSAGPERDMPGTEFFVTQPLTLAARGLTPLSPVHLRSTRAGDGWRLSWIRRTRIGGDSWESEAPLGETTERYEVSILRDGVAVRVGETTAPVYDYPSSQIIEDFGSNPANHPQADGPKFTVRQWSDRVGWGLTGERHAE